MAVTPQPVRIGPGGSGARFGHRRTQSDAIKQGAPVNGSTHPNNLSATMVEEEVDPFRPKEKKDKRKPVLGGTPKDARGSFRQIFSSPEEDGKGGKKTPAVIAKAALQGLRNRAGTRSKLPLPEVNLKLEDDVKEESRDSELLAPVVPTPEPLPVPELTPRSRGRAGGMVVPKNTDKKVEEILARIYAIREECQAPLQSLVDLREDCQSCLTEVNQSLFRLTEVLAQAKKNGDLAEYESAAEELQEDVLSSKLRFTDRE